MFRETSPCHLTNMVMVKRINPENNIEEVLVIERTGEWSGITFPGGHVEKAESMTQSAIREIKEETGLSIKKIRLKSIIDWYNVANSERFFVFCYICDDFEGELKSNEREGKVFFTALKDLEKMKLCSGFKEQLPVFLDDYSEYFGTYGDGLDHPILLI